MIAPQVTTGRCSSAMQGRQNPSVKTSTGCDDIARDRFLIGQVFSNPTMLNTGKFSAPFNRRVYFEKDRSTYTAADWLLLIL